MTNIKKVAVCSPVRTGSTLVWQIATEILGRRAGRRHAYFYSPECTILVPYRDLRDALCSFANIRGGCSQKTLSGCVKIMFEVQDAIGLLHKYIEDSKNKKNVFLVKYEDFFGYGEKLVSFISEKMEVSLDSNEVSRIANKFSLEANKERANQFKHFGQWCRTTMIHGNHITNDGRIGVWKEFFNEEIKIEVGKFIGKLLIELDYEKNYDWIGEGQISEDVKKELAITEKESKPASKPASKLASILIPTRGRFDSLLKAVGSIVNNTKDLNRVEIIIRFDDDDQKSLSRIDELPKDKIDMNIMIGKRYQYIELHKYVNEMCKETKGEFIVWFNDDCIIETAGWDNILFKYTGKIVCLYPDNKGTGSGNIFPVISRKIYEALGHFSLSQQVDTWQSHICLKAGVEIKVNDLVFIHNRKQDYVSDKDRKDILRKTRRVWKNTKDDRAKDIKKIKQFLKN